MTSPGFLDSNGVRNVIARMMKVRFAREKGTERELEMLTSFSLIKNEKNPEDETLSDALDSSDSSVMTEMDESVGESHFDSESIHSINQ